MEKIALPIKVQEVTNLNYFTFHLMDCFNAMKGRREGYKNIEMVK